MELSIQMYFLLFMIYSILGWCLEVTCKAFEYKKFIDRGFLIGPYCPIYGWGAVLITFLLYRYSYDALVLFIMTTIVCGILEYLTSFFMEKLFKARWWDYSKRKFNINGRVCLGTLIPFGIFGLILTYIANPFFIGLLNKLNTNTINILAISLFTIFTIDSIISFIVIFGFRKTTVIASKEKTSDNTEEMTKKVKELLMQKSFLYRRIVNAYPKFVAIKSRIAEIKDEIEDNINEVKENINEKKTEVITSINEKAKEVNENISNKKNKVKMKIKVHKDNIKRHFIGEKEERK